MQSERSRRRDYSGSTPHQPEELYLGNDSYFGARRHPPSCSEASGLPHTVRSAPAAQIVDCSDSVPTRECNFRRGSWYARVRLNSGERNTSSQLRCHTGGLWERGIEESIAPLPEGYYTEASGIRLSPRSCLLHLHLHLHSHILNLHFFVMFFGFWLSVVVSFGDLRHPAGLAVQRGILPVRQIYDTSGWRDRRCSIVDPRTCCTRVDECRASER
ncbi:hypothetical protein DFP72DRAFT_636998 [Ephemerocybe angulata]|uniref:Uncharacterized protein n=1 Tax=Ephemerocybe angulata TaxID=980116 RepID=A0A8H6HH82_9AGAR|nr:hypothetical protein DFP72DRAFT_636998 [Tulosesus angulatus]